MNRISGAERYMSLVADYREQNAARPGEEAGPPKDLGRSGELPALRECGL
jgi:hypothetical protein